MDDVGKLISSLSVAGKMTGWKLRIGEDLGSVGTVSKSDFKT